MMPSTNEHVVHEQLTVVVQANDDTADVRKSGNELNAPSVCAACGLSDISLPEVDAVKQAQTQEIPTSGSTSKHLSSAGLLVTAICMGLMFGVAMERAKVTSPVTVRKQFLMQRFIMFKMFLAAAATGCLLFSIMSLIIDNHFETVRSKFMSSRKAKGMVPVVIGTFILGCGMAVSGACPGMVYIQIGAGVENAVLTLVGGFAGAMIYGLAQPFMETFLGIGMTKAQKVDDLKVLEGVKYWKMGLAAAACMCIPIALFEYYFPWQSPNEISQYTPWAHAWLPELSGILIGALQVPAVLITSGTLGASSTYMTIVSQILVTKSLRDFFKHMEGFRASFVQWQSVVFVWSAALGAFIAAKGGDTFGSSRGVQVGPAFIGGVLMIFGSRMAGGCTSGHGLSGMALLSLQSLAAVPSMFAGGIATAFIYNAVDSGAYMGALQ